MSNTIQHTYCLNGLLHVPQLEKLSVCVWNGPELDPQLFDPLTFLTSLRSLECVSEKRMQVKPRISRNSLSNN